MSEPDMKRVLIVDDEPIIVELLAEGLRKMDDHYIIETAATGEDALTKISQIEYALVISDYKMPGLNGLELAQIIRQKSPKTRLVIITAYGSENLKDKGEFMRVDAFLDKPVSLKKVREIVMQVVGEAAHGEDDRLEKEPDLPGDIKESLSTLKVNVNARAVLLLSASGHLLEMAGNDKSLDIPNISTLVAANFMAATELAKLLGNESVFRSSYYEGPNYNVYAHDLNGDCFLAVIFGSRSKSGMVRFYTSAAIETLKPLLENIDFRHIDMAGELQEEVEEQLDQLFRRDLGL